MRKYFSNSKGVSLITLVITIIVIIILAAIVLFTSLTTVDNANYATFVSEYDEINSGTQAKLKNNILNGKSEEERNAGFTKVKVENAPGSFVSVSDDSISGYVINLDTIKVTGTKTGKGEVINETVTFGKDDVYIYDDEGKDYYAKGYSDGSGEIKYRIEDTENINSKPTIENVSFDLNADGSSAVITVIVKSGNGGGLTVTGGGKTATKTSENTYEIEVSQNGTVTIIVREDGGGTETGTIEIAGITKPKYTITYNLNGGTSSTEIPAQTIEVGTPTRITSVTQASGTISWAKSSVEVTLGSTNFENKLSKKGDGAVTFSSTKESVATVDENGKVTIIGEGETTITATVANGTNYTYTQSTASYTLKIEVPVYYLMSRGSSSYVIGYNRTGSSSTYTSNLIKTITLQNTKSAPENYETLGIATWDVSANCNRTVMAYLVKNEESTESITYYDLYIGADIEEKGKLMEPGK